MWQKTPLTPLSFPAYDSPMRWFLGPKRWLATLLFLTAASGVAWAQKHERKRAERAEILAMETQWRDAQLQDDTAAMEHLLADDFLGITASGQVVTKTQQLDRMRSRQIAISKLDIGNTRVKMSGNLAVVTSVAQLDGTANGAPLHGSYRYTRVYQRVPGSGWRITNFEATRVPDDAGPGGGKIKAPQANVAGPPAGVPKFVPVSRAGSVFPLPPS